MLDIVAALYLGGATAAGPEASAVGQITAVPTESQLAKLYPPVDSSKSGPVSLRVSCLFPPGQGKPTCDPAEPENTRLTRTARQAGALFRVSPSKPDQWRVLRISFYWAAAGSPARGPKGEQAWFEIERFEPTIPPPPPITADAGNRRTEDVVAPVFIRRPTRREIRAAYPAGAHPKRAVQIDMYCDVEADGRLGNCPIVSQDGASSGEEGDAFIEASKVLAHSSYRVDPSTITTRVGRTIAHFQFAWPTK